MAASPKSKDAAEAGCPSEDKGLVPMIEEPAHRTLAGVHGEDDAQEGCQERQIEEQVRAARCHLEPADEREHGELEAEADDHAPGSVGKAPAGGAKMGQCSLHPRAGASMAWLVVTSGTSAGLRLARSKVSPALSTCRRMSYMESARSGRASAMLDRVTPAPSTT
jgi:hypothetical protein